jgi:hypothetical protein
MMVDFHSAYMWMNDLVYFSFSQKVPVSLTLKWKIRAKTIFDSFFLQSLPFFAPERIMYDLLISRRNA